MRYLLDVNSLVALGFAHHEFHERVATWVRKIATEKSELATCAITELGFVRVLAQAAQYGLSVAQARDLLTQLKSSSVTKFVFLVDDHDVSHLPSWVKTPRQTTDGHLEQLAKSKHAVLATLDRQIPRAFLIPE
jgi:predicted nucleic acid-binding protein